MSRFKNRLTAKVLTRFRWLFDRAINKTQPYLDSGAIPWVPMTKRLSECRVAIVTTAGVHLKGEPPFDMVDKDGDPSFRAIPLSAPDDALMITHDYYDHADAEKDINIVFPIDRLKEMAKSGLIGEVAPVNYSFMGHIDGRHIETLVSKTGPQVAGLLKSARVDAVLLTPG